MTDTTLSDEINIMINDQLKSLPYPIKCKITKVYEDNKHCDVETNNGKLTYLEAICNNLTVGNTGIVIYLNGGSEECLVITK